MMAHSVLYLLSVGAGYLVSWCLIVRLLVIGSSVAKWWWLVGLVVILWW